jgi:hypothetical protein
LAVGRLTVRTAIAAKITDIALKLCVLNISVPPKPDKPEPNRLN